MKRDLPDAKMIVASGISEQRHGLVAGTESHQAPAKAEWMLN
jgi:hypothetical protein